MELFTFKGLILLHDMKNLEKEKLHWLLWKIEIITKWHAMDEYTENTLNYLFKITLLTNFRYPI